MIIKLTECRKVDGKPNNSFDIYVNTDNVLTFNRSINGDDTHIKLFCAFLFVKETPEEIIEKMVLKLSVAEALSALPPGCVPFEMLNGARK